MIRILLLVAALVALAACREDGPSASRETSPGGIEYTLLDLPEHEAVTIQVAWPTDWAYRSGTNKAAPLIGAQVILAGGAEGHPAGEVVERFADLDSEGNIHVALNDHVIGELTFERDRMAETVEIANAHLRAPALEHSWFERIRHGIAQNMAEAQARPAHASFDAVRWAVFGRHPLRNAMSLDEPGTFEALTRDDIAAWHAETFTRNPDAVVVAGGIDAGAAGAALDALFEGLPESGRAMSRETAPDFAPRRILLHRPNAEVTNLAFIAPLPPTRLGGEAEDLILIHALGGDDQSVLFNAVRTGLRASYAFGAGMANYTRDHRILFMTGEVEADKLAEVERVVGAAYARFREHGPQGPLADRKAPLEARFSELADFVVDQARSELQSALDGHSPGRSLELNDVVAAVTEDTVTARLRDEFPAPDGFIVIAVSPDADAFPGACVILAPREATNCP